MTGIGIRKFVSLRIIIASSSPVLSDLEDSRSKTAWWLKFLLNELKPEIFLVIWRNLNLAEEWNRRESRLSYEAGSSIRRHARS